MNPGQLITLIITLHFIADFNVQMGGRLHDLKCKEWWDAQLKNASDYDKDQYKYDYLVALWIHSFVWAAITFAPILWLAGDKITTWIVFGANVVMHGMADNAKANWRCLNLLQDQMFHLAQIILAVLFFYKTEALKWLM